MVTLKDIAQETGLSASTVSIVLKGNGNARKISQDTQEKVLSTAKRLGYKPNIQARILRGGVPTRYTITLFWASDIRIHMLSRFLNGLQNALMVNHYPCDLQIKPYDNHHLCDVLTQEAMLSCNGMIICNPSEQDMAFLEQLDCLVPVVLYNRYSEKYFTVNMDDETIGRLPAEVFARHGKTRPAILKAPATFHGMEIRTSVFESRTQAARMEPPISVLATDSMDGGYAAALQLCSINPLPDCLLCMSDNIALGALKAFHQKGVRIPEDLELISVGNGSPEQQAYAIPSLSVVNLPMEDMAAACLKSVYEKITNSDSAPGSMEFPIHYIARESCPE